MNQTRAELNIKTASRPSDTLSNQIRLRLLFVTVVVSLLAFHSARAATLPPGFVEQPVTLASGAANLASATAMGIAPDGRIFVAQQGGQLRVVKDNVVLAAPFLTVTVDSLGERGLLGVTFDPDFANNQYVYIYYTVPVTPRHNRISRFTANGDIALAGSEVVIMDLDPLNATNHNGGAIHFGPDGKLYVAVGENAVGSNAQSLTTRHGKILRINGDGSIPTDNPFFSAATGLNRSIWARGLRNPYTFSFQNGTGRMYINDVGQSAVEEVNEGIAGANYGWPTCEGACSNPAFTNPVHQYPNDSSTCAITGGAFYSPTRVQFPALYAGKYLFADFCGGWIRRIDPASPSTSTGFATGIQSPVDLAVSSDGYLYYLSRGSGTLVRVRYVWRGDANGDDVLTVADVFHLVNFLFAAGPPPIGNPDANSDGETTVSDVFFLVNYLFANGAAPAP